MCHKRYKLYNKREEFDQVMFVSFPIQVMYLCIRGISCICVLRVSILPISMILIYDFGMVPTVWYFLKWCQQCGIFWNGANSVVFFSPFYHKVIYISNKMANHRSDRATSVQYSPISGSVPRGTTGIPDSCPTYQRSYLWLRPLESCSPLFH